MQITHARRGARIFGLALAALAIAVPTASAHQARHGHKRHGHHGHTATRRRTSRSSCSAINDFHGHLAPDTPGTIQTGCCVTNPATATWTQTTVPAGGIAYLATHIKALRARHREQLRRRRGRHDRRQPAGVGALPRRADDRGAEHDRPRRRRRRQPRVRRGHRRAAAHAVRQPPRRRRVPSRRRLPGRHAVPRRAASRTWPPTSSSRARTGRSSRPTRSSKVDGAKIALHRHDLRGDADRRDAVRRRGARLPRRGRRPPTRSCASSAASRASRRSSCCCTRAARSVRRRRPPRRARRPARSTPTSTSASTSTAPRSRTSPPGSTSASA